MKLCISKYQDGILGGYNSCVMGNKFSDPNFLSEIKNESDIVEISDTHIYDEILEKLDTSEFDIALYKNNKILETGTSNLIFVKKNKIYTPKINCYIGNTLKFFKKKYKINFTNILKYKNIVKVPLIASGGVSNFQDIKKLYSFNLDGVIVGKAIYDNKVNLKEIFSIKKNVKN